MKEKKGSVAKAFGGDSDVRILFMDNFFCFFETNVMGFKYSMIVLICFINVVVCTLYTYPGKSKKFAHLGE